jgi:hypothetical protein
MPSDPELVLNAFVRTLQQLGVSYAVGGSLASSLYGIPRSTNDIDVLVLLEEMHAAPLVSSLRNEFYIDLDSVVWAIRNRGSFNLIHLPTFYKIDVFVPSKEGWPSEEISRVRKHNLTEDSNAPGVFFSSPEDNILHKLEWFRKGGEISEQQWTDVVGVLQVQGNALDLSYLRRWSALLGVDDLLEKALKDSGLAS